MKHNGEGLNSDGEQKVAQRATLSGGPMERKLFRQSIVCSED